MRPYIKLLTVFIFFPLVTAVAQNDADFPGRHLVMKPHAAISDVPVDAACTIANTAIPAATNVTSWRGPLNFKGKNPKGGSLVVSKINKPVLPDISPGEVESESVIAIQSNSMYCFIRAYVTSEEWFNYAIVHAAEYGNQIKAMSDSWIIFDMSQPSAENTLSSNSSLSASTSVTSTATSSDAGIESYVSDDGAVLNLKGVCGHAYIPYTRYGYGTVTWLNNPGPAGWSMKDENISSKNPATLRCPSGPYRTDYYVDGVYNTHSRRGSALKIPNHCAAKRVVEPGFSGFSACCTAAYVPIWGTIKYISTLGLVDWPDVGKRCG